MTDKSDEVTKSDNEIENQIFWVRGKKVMLDFHLAEIYGVVTKRLSEQVKRNIERFPEHFMFQLSENEFKNLRSQIATSSLNDDNLLHGGRRRPPYAFTKHGAVMLASVLKSETAIKASIKVVEAFVHLRRVLANNRELADKIAKLEERYDDQFAAVFKAIRRLMEPPADDLDDRIMIGYKPS